MEYLKRHLRVTIKLGGTHENNHHHHKEKRPGHRYHRNNRNLFAGSRSRKRHLHTLCFPYHLCPHHSRPGPRNRSRPLTRPTAYAPTDFLYTPTRPLSHTRSYPLINHWP